MCNEQNSLTEKCLWRIFWQIKNIYKRMKLICILIWLLPIVCSAQQITLSEPQNGNSREMNFEIIGKVNGNLLIYKYRANNHFISTYNSDMELKGDVDLDFIPGKISKIDFIAYPNFVYCIYQYYSKGVVHCMWVKLDSQGKKVFDPAEIDQSDVGSLGEHEIYSVIRSDDKKYIMIFKMMKSDRNFVMESFLYDINFVSENHQRYTLAGKDSKQEFDNFLLDNDGDLVFTKTNKISNRGKINQLTLYSIKRNSESDSLTFKNIQLENNYLENVNLKIDNAGKKYLLAAFFHKQRNANVNGIFIDIWDKQSSSNIVNAFRYLTGDSTKVQVNTGKSGKTALNDFNIRNIIVKKDGGFIIMAEEFYTRQRSNYYGPYDMFYSPFMSPYGFNYYNRYYGSPYYYDSYNSNRYSYYYNNVVVLSFLKNAEIDWTNSLEKSQQDDVNDKYLSFENITSGDEIHFLYNKTGRNNNVLFDYILDAKGNVVSNDILKMQDHGYDFMPQFGKQVSAKQLIIPCTNRNSLCFAKIEF